MELKLKRVSLTILDKLLFLIIDILIYLCVFIGYIIKGVWYVIWNFTYCKRVLPHLPRFFWHNLWIRKDEFHHSLNQDNALLMVLNKKHREMYRNNLCRRRRIAHNRGH